MTRLHFFKAAFGAALCFIGLRRQRTVVLASSLAIDGDIIGKDLRRYMVKLDIPVRFIDCHFQCE